MEKHNIKYVDEMICFQEIPDETTLSFSISNCPHHCPGCHSSYLAQDVGIPLEAVLEERLEFYEGLITCVLFMGGDDEAQRNSLLRCNEKCKKRGLKTALYSGAEDLPDDVWIKFDYVKIGPYIEQLGGLASSTTNQRLYKKQGEYWKDITYRFWKKELPHENTFNL